MYIHAALFKTDVRRRRSEKRDSKKTNSKSNISKRKRERKKMSPEEKEKLFAIKCRSKRGEYISPEEHEFCTEMYRKYPDEYGEDDERVFNATRPFGS